MRLEELDAALKSGNIERALVGIGSTRPEELRERRRKLLTIEWNGLQEQLNLLEEGRPGIESAIAAAERAAYLSLRGVARAQEARAATGTLRGAVTVTLQPARLPGQPGKRGVRQILQRGRAEVRTQVRDREKVVVEGSWKSPKGYSSSFLYATIARYAFWCVYS
jgi:hypothetical protein